MGIVQQQSAIRELEEIILKTKRAYDVIARTSTEEFVWLLPQTGEQGAATVKSRLLAALQAAQRKVDKARPLTDLVQIGIASALPSNHKIEDLVGRARERVQGG